MTVGIKLGRQNVGNNQFSKYDGGVSRNIIPSLNGLQAMSHSTESSTTEPFMYLDEYLKSDLENQTPSASTYELSSHSTNPYQVRAKVNKKERSDVQLTWTGTRSDAVSSSRNANLNNHTPQHLGSSDRIDCPKQFSQFELLLSTAKFGGKMPTDYDPLRSYHSTPGRSSEADEAVFVEMSASVKPQPQSIRTPDSGYSVMELSTFGKPAAPHTQSRGASVNISPESLDYNLGFQSTRHNVKVKFSPVETVLPSHVSSGRSSEQSFTSQFSHKSTKSITTRLNQTIFGVLSELITTERSYCNSLYVFSEVVAKTICTKTNSPLKDLRALFPRSLPDIYALHVEMLQQMERGMGGLTEQDTLNDIFTDDRFPLPHEILIQFLQLHGDQMNCGLVCSLYTRYLDEFTCAMRTLQRLMRQSFRFRHTVKKLRDHPECEGFDFAAFLLSPVQRLPRYLLLVRQLSKQFEKLIEIDAVNSFLIDKALSTSKKAEMMLHEILVELDARLASYLQYPKANGLAVENGLFRDTVNKSTGVKRIKSLPMESTKSTVLNGDKKTGKHGIWPRLRRAFSEKRVDNTKIIVGDSTGDTLSRFTKDRGDTASYGGSTETVAGNTNDSDQSDESQVITAACVEPDLAEIGSLCVPDHTTDQTDDESINSPPPHLVPEETFGLVSCDTQTTPGLGWPYNPLVSNNRDEIAIAMGNWRSENQAHQQIQVEFPLPTTFLPPSGSQGDVNESESDTETKIDQDSNKPEKGSACSEQNTVSETSSTPEYATPPASLADSEFRNRRASFSNVEENCSDDARTASSTPSFSPTHSSTLPRQYTRNGPWETRVKSHTLLARNEIGREIPRKFSLKKLFRRNIDNKTHIHDTLSNGDALRKLQLPKTISSPQVNIDEEASEHHKHRTSCFRIKSKHSQSTEFRHNTKESMQSVTRTRNHLLLDHAELDHQVFVDETGNVCFSV